MTDRDIIKKYLGVPFKHQGRNIQEGLDCWGLIRAIYADHEVELFDLESYEVDWAKVGRNYFIEHYSEQWEKVDQPDFMDVVLFQTSSVVVNHAGLVLNNSKFIHASKAGIIVSRLGELQIFKRIAGFYRLKNDNDKISSQQI